MSRSSQQCQLHWCSEPASQVCFIPDKDGTDTCRLCDDHAGIDKSDYDIRNVITEG